jgi:hypothetical protein
MEAFEDAVGLGMMGLVRLWSMFSTAKYNANSLTLGSFYTPTMR